MGHDKTGRDQRDRSPAELARQLQFVESLTRTQRRRSSSMKVFEPGLRYQMTPSLSFVSAYQYTMFEGHHWHEVALATHYPLSKRTELYTSVDWMRASEGVDAVIGYSFTPSTARNQTAVRAAICHVW